MRAGAGDTNDSGEVRAGLEGNTVIIVQYGDVGQGDIC